MTPAQQAARIELRLAELRVLAAETSLEETLRQQAEREATYEEPAAIRWLLAPLRAPTYDPWRTEVRRQTQRIKAAYYRRLLAR
jgi:hypothetical protein